VAAVVVGIQTRAPRSSHGRASRGGTHSLRSRSSANASSTYFTHGVAAPRRDDEFRIRYRSVVGVPKHMLPSTDDDARTPTAARRGEPVGRLRAFVRYERQVGLSGLDARRGYVCIRRPGLRFYVIETIGLTVESRIFVASPHLWPDSGDRPVAVGHLSIPLEGTYLARRSGTERMHERRFVAVDPTSIFDERWQGPRFRMLCVEWGLIHGRPITSPSDLVLSALDDARLGAFADAIGDGTIDDDATRAVVELLRAIGVPLARLDATLSTSAPAGAIETARTLTSLHTHLDSHPDLSDVETELGVSSRQFRRRLHAHPEWSVLPIPSWRTSMRRMRVRLAPAFATARGATVERIAAALGYRSASALLYALDAEGAPSPALARRVTLT